MIAKKKKKFFSPGIKMSGKNIKCGDKKKQKSKLHRCQ